MLDRTTDFYVKGNATKQHQIKTALFKQQMSSTA